MSVMFHLVLAAARDPRAGSAPAKDQRILEVVRNRKATFNYEILERYEAGIELVGTEVKSVREAQISIAEAFVRVRNNELQLLNCNIAPHSSTAAYFNHEPRRTRRLLMHKREIRRVDAKMQQKGLTIIPLRMYFKGQWLKVEVGLARGKKLYDKREDITRRDVDRKLGQMVKKLTL
eukprot:jgi/Mesvir1/26035/Mv09580-RA.1